MRTRGLCFLAAGLMASVAFGVEVPVSVREPLGLARANQPATGGIPFKPGQVKDVKDLALVGADGKAIPAQFTVLNKHADGSARWVLVDFLCTVPANGTAKYTLKTGVKNPAPKTPLKITDDGGAVTVDTGVARFGVNKGGYAEFILLAGVTVDGKPVVTKIIPDLVSCELEEKEVGKGRRKSIQATMKQGGGTFQCYGWPTRVKWEYKGPLRSTLRVDGVYRVSHKAAPKLNYTARITAWAGCPSVRIEYAVRNSNPAGGVDAFIKRAALDFTLAVDAKPEGAGLDWAAGGDGNVGLLIQHRHTGGIYRGPGTYLRGLFGCGWSRGWPGLYRQEVRGRRAFVEIISKGPVLTGRRAKQGALGFTQDGTFVLADRAHKTSEIWLDFYTGARSKAANEARAKAFRSKLMLFAPGEWYSETDALGIGRFGTLADEIATYRKWGWKGADGAGRYKPPKLPHQPFAYVPSESIHDVSEDDCVEGYLLQYLRTGDRGFYDWAEAWAGFYRAHAIYRNDWGKGWGVGSGVAPPKGKRTNKGLAFHWYGPHMYGWPDTRMHRCHHYGRGIFDLYHITGNVDMLEAGLDLAQQMSAGWERYRPGRAFGFGRAWGRKLLTFISAWQATGDPRWKNIADTWAACVLKAPNWDPKLKLYRQSLGIKNSYFARAWTKGHFDLKSNPRWESMFKTRSIPPRIDKYLTDNGITCRYHRGAIIAKKGKGAAKGAEWEVTYLPQVFELSACHMALERYARLFDDKAMQKRLCEITEGVARHYWSDKCHFMIGSPWFGWPDRDKVLDPADWQSSHDKCPANGGGRHSGYATRYTADMFARCYSFTKDPKWLALAKRSWSRGSKRLYNRQEQCAGADEVGPFAYIRGAHNNTLTEGSARMFYEVPRSK